MRISGHNVQKLTRLGHNTKRSSVKSSRSIPAWRGMESLESRLLNSATSPWEGLTPVESFGFNSDLVLRADPGIDALLAGDEHEGEDHLEVNPFTFAEPSGTAEDSGTTTTASTFTSTGVPILHSSAGSAVKLYLDFDGHFEAQWGSRSNITSPAFDIDDDPSTFTNTELARIEEVWTRVAEDFAPFNIDVTTEPPAGFGNGQAMRIVIGGSSFDWYGSGAGGVAYINAFTGSPVNTAYVFPEQLGNGTAKYVAEAASHESGHSFGLEHQSTWSGGSITQQYNPGGNGWAPIMGNSYSQALSTWHNGQSSTGALQDDMAHIARTQNGFGFRVDDFGNSNIDAAALLVNGSAVSASGLIGQMGDTDAFYFDTGAGSVTLNVNTISIGPNLDTKLSLFDSLGTLVASADPTSTLGATITANLALGRYFLQVAGNGEYGRLGQYTVDGTIVAGEQPTPEPEVAVTHDSTGIADDQIAPIDFGSSQSGVNGPTRTFTVVNTGNATLTLGAVTLPEGFTLIEGLVESLQAGQSDTFTVQMSTDSIGVKSGVVSFTTNDSTEPTYNFNITGTVTPAPETPEPEVGVSHGGANITDDQATSIGFGNVEQGAAGPLRTFTITNGGQATLTLGTVGLPEGFTLVDGLVGTLEAGQSDTFTVQMATDSTGTKSGAVTFNTNDGDEPAFNFNITGTVTQTLPTPEPEIAVSDGGAGVVDEQTIAIGFGNVELGTNGPSRTFTVSNTGNSTLTLGAVNLPEGFTLIEGLAGSLEAGQSDTFTVQLSSSSAGAKSGVVSFTTDDGDEPLFNFNITGTVTQTPVPQYPRGFDALNPLTFLDADGDLVTISLRGEGTGTAVFTGEAEADVSAIVLDGTTDKSSLRITATGSTTVGNVTVSGSLSQISAAGISLTGNLQVAGSVTGITFGNVGGGAQQTFGIGGDATSAGVTLTLGDVHDVTIDSGAAIRSLTVASWSDGLGIADQIITSTIGRLSSFGDFDAGLSLSGAEAGYTLGRADVRGTLDGAWDVDGDVQSVRAVSTAESWELRSSGYVASIGSLGLLEGSVEAHTFGSIRTRGGLTADLTATGADEAGRSIRSLKAGSVFDSNLDAEGSIGSISGFEWRGGDIQAASLGSVIIRGDFSAGMSLTDGSAGLTLGRMVVGGTVDAAHIRCAGDVGTVTLGVMRDSTLHVGVAPGVAGLPQTGDQFDALRSVKALHIRGVSFDGSAQFVNSNIAAWSIGSVTLGNVQTVNGGQQFGIALSQFTRFTYEPAGSSTQNAKARSQPSGPAAGDMPIDDFIIRLF